MAKRTWKLALSALAFVFVGITFVYSTRSGGRDNGVIQPSDETAAFAQAQTPDNATGPADASVRSNAAQHVGQTDVLRMAPYTRWQTFTTQDGLPADKVFCVKVDGARVWAGTTGGLACYENGRWRAYGTEDGLPYRAVLSLDVSPITGDLWIGTMGGLARYSGGRFDVFTQNNSGLSNNFVNAVQCDPDSDYVWAATAMGASRFNLRTREWTIFTEQNTPMNEPWTYSVSIDRGLVYIGAWGAGVLEYTPGTERWRVYTDPDGEMEVDIFPDDGPVHDVTAGVAYRDGILWQATYFGVSRYDGRRWRTYYTEDSGLASNFVQFVRARGRTAWMCTDDGLSVTDGENWMTYRRLDNGQGEVLSYEGQSLKTRRVTSTAPAHNFVLGIDFQGDALWVSTEKGVSRGTP